MTPARAMKILHTMQKNASRRAANLKSWPLFDKNVTYQSTAARLEEDARALALALDALGVMPDADSAEKPFVVVLNLDGEQLFRQTKAKTPDHAAVAAWKEYCAELEQDPNETQGVDVEYVFPGTIGFADNLSGALQSIVEGLT